MMKGKVSKGEFGLRREPYRLVLAVVLAMGIAGSLVSFGDGKALAAPSPETGLREEGLADLSDLADLLAVAVDHSPNLKMAALALDEAISGSEQLVATLRPQLSVAGQHKAENAINLLEYEKLAGLGLNPGDRLQTTIGSVTWYQQLGANSQLGGLMRQAQIGERIAELGQSKALTELILAVQTGYHGVLRANNSLALSREAQEHARLNVIAAETKQGLGIATPLDVLKERNAYLEAEQVSQAAMVGVEMAVMALLQTMGQGPVTDDAALFWAEQLAQSHELQVELWEIDADCAQRYMLTHRPELAMANEQAAMAEVALAQVQSERDWTIRFNGQYRPDDEGTLQLALDSEKALTLTAARMEVSGVPEMPATGMPGGTAFSRPDPWQVELSASYRFGDGGAKQARIAAKEAAYKKAALQVEVAEAGFCLELSGALKQLAQLWQGYLLAEEGMRAAQDTLIQLEQMYEFGSLTNKEVREGRLMVRQAQNKVLDTGFSYEAQKGKVAALVGIPAAAMLQSVTSGRWQDNMGDWGADGN